MKKHQLIFLLSITTVFNCVGQVYSNLSEKDSIHVEKKVKSAAIALKNKLDITHQDDYLQNLENEFAVDTFKIEERQRLSLAINSSTNAMVASALIANQEYDRLLNKYYKRLFEKLEDTDQKVLQQAQRNWIKFRDVEIELNMVSLNTYYAGEGNMLNGIAAVRISEITQNRLFEIYHYLRRSNN